MTEAEKAALAKSALQHHLNARNRERTRNRMEKTTIPIPMRNPGAWSGLGIPGIFPEAGESRMKKLIPHSEETSARRG